MIPINGQPRFYPVTLTSERTDAAGVTGVTGVTADSFGIRLFPAESPSPLAFDSADGSVGRITLPQGFAIDAQQRCYFAERATGTIWFFDPRGSRSGAQPFSRILRFPPSPRPDDRWSLAANSESLYIIRPDQPSLISVALGHWAIQDIHCFRERARDVATFRDPVTFKEVVYVLTDCAIYSYRSPGTWKLFAELHTKNYTRLLIGKAGEVFVQVNKGDVIPVRKGDVISVTDHAAAAQSPDRTRFPIPPVVTHPAPGADKCFQYVIPATVSLPVETCPSRVTDDPGIPPELAVSEITREMLESDDLSFGFLIREDGTRVRKFQPSTQRLFLTGHEKEKKDDGKEKKDDSLPGVQQPASVWHSPVIDSNRYRCRWDRVELELQIPAGCQVVISTLTLDPDPSSNASASESKVKTSNSDFDLEKDVLKAAEPNWSLGASFEANPRQSSEKQKWEKLDFLVRSKPGRYLFLRVQLFGDGFSTPVVRNLMARGPRQSHVDFLPAVMREDDVSRDFLERFVSAFQTEWDRLEKTVDEMDRLFNPVAIDERQLVRLADEIGIPLPAGWNNKQYRNLLQFAPELLMAPGDEQQGRVGGSRRGTVEHIRKAVRAVLGGLTGLSEQQMRGFPWVIEGHRDRNQLRLGVSDPLPGRMTGDRLAPPMARTLWGPDSTGRLQLGDNSVLGERKLLPTARQELDLYRTYAHRIRVVVPACWVPKHDDRCVLEAMIDAEKPAHVACDITLVRAGMRIGLQSTVGVDTILGDWPPAVLAANPAPTLGLGQGLVLPDSHDQRPPPLPVAGTLGTHTL